jgi:hypothetical protein
MARCWNGLVSSSQAAVGHGADREIVIILIAMEIVVA